MSMTADAPANHTSTPTKHPQEAQIRERAFQLYEGRGGEPGDGREVEDWLAAERELIDAA